MVFTCVFIARKYACMDDPGNGVISGQVSGLPWQRHVADLEEADDDDGADSGPTAADANKITTPSGVVVITFLQGQGEVPQMHDSVRTPPSVRL